MDCLNSFLSFGFFKDDIDLEDPGEKPKGQNMMAALNKQKLTSKFQALKGQKKTIDYHIIEQLNFTSLLSMKFSYSFDDPLLFFIVFVMCSLISVSFD